MDSIEQPVRKAPRPILVGIAVIYCLLITLKIGHWLVNEGWEGAYVGDFPIFYLVPVVVTCVLLVVGSLLLWVRSKKSSGYLLGALLFGLTLAPIMIPEIFQQRANMFGQVAWYVLPSALQAALLVAVWLYSLQLRRTGYFDVATLQNNR